MDEKSLQSALNVISAGSQDFDRRELKREALEEAEKKVVLEFPKYMNTDLASVITSFVKLGYVPHGLLEELNKLKTLSTFNKYACLAILESLLATGSSSPTVKQVYEKLLEQLQKNSANMNTKLVSRALAILVKYKRIVRADKDIHAVVQFYVDRFNDSVKSADVEVSNEVVLSALENVRQLTTLHKEHAGDMFRDIETTKFFHNCTRLLEDRIEKLRPEVFFKSMEMLEDAKLKERYLQAMLGKMRSNKYDIRKFDFNQLATFINLVAMHSKKDLHVFYRYLLNCLEQNFFPMMTLEQDDNFRTLSKLFYLFVKEGFVSA